MDAKSEHFNFEKLELDMDSNLEWEHGHEERLNTAKVWAEGTLVQKEFYYLIKIFNLTKNSKIIHYVPVLWGVTDGKIGKVKFIFPRILLEFRASFYIILRKHMQKLRKKNDQSGPLEYTKRWIYH